MSNKSGLGGNLSQSMNTISYHKSCPTFWNFGLIFLKLCMSKEQSTVIVKTFFFLEWSTFTDFWKKKLYAIYIITISVSRRGVFLCELYPFRVNITPWNNVPLWRKHLCLLHINHNFHMDVVWWLRSSGISNIKHFNHSATCCYFV